MLLKDQFFLISVYNGHVNRQDIKNRKLTDKNLEVPDVSILAWLGILL